MSIISNKLGKGRVTNYLNGKSISESNASHNSKGYFPSSAAVRCIITGDYLYKLDPDTVEDCARPGRYFHINKGYACLTGIDSNKKYILSYTASRANNFIDIIGLKDGKRNVNYCSSLAVVRELGMKEDYYTGVFYTKEAFDKREAVLYPRNYQPFDPPMIDKSKRTNLLKYGMISASNVITEGKDYTFGVEIETSGGFLPTRLRKDFNVACVYDGSIRDDNDKKNVGGEYVTGVLRGDNGFNHLHKLTNELSKRCVINNTCSFHVHIGNVIFNKETIIALWKISQLLEKELYSMMPPSRLGREHCRPMKHINFDMNKKGVSREVLVDEYFNKIFHVVSMGKSPSKSVNKKFNHPAGNHCGFDTSTPRYWWVNFVPAMFNLKGEDNYTIEYRMHGATLNFSKMKNWINIVMAIVSMAENYQKEVFNAKTLTLAEVLSFTYKKKGSYLSNYVEERKKLFSSSFNKLEEKIEYSDRNNSDSSLPSTVWT